MANETMQFVLITALFGMAVVALFLSLLSLVMYLIRSTDEAVAKRVAHGAQLGGGRRGSDRDGLDTAAGRAEGGAPDIRSRSGRPTSPVPLWAIAAAAVYLEAEGEAARHSAHPWTARAGR